MAIFEKWNDPAIAQLNPSVAVPEEKIAVVARRWFWHYIYLHALSVENEPRVQGKNRKQYFGRLAHGHGRQQNKMTYVQLQNQAGRFVTPNSASFQAAAANADWAHSPGFDLMLTGQAGAGSWPITGAIFILVYEKQDRPEAAREVLKFFDWAYRHGDKLAEQLDYVPMPAAIAKLVEDTWKKQIKDVSGKTVWTDGLIQK